MNKKKLIIILSCFGIWIVFIFISKFHVPTHEIKKVSSKSETQKSDIKNTTTPEDLTTAKSKVILINNETSPAIKKARLAYEKRLGEKAKIIITPLRKSKIKLKGKEYDVEEVSFEILRGKQHTSFQAHIDAKTGNVLQTWNQTRKDGLFFKNQNHSTFKPTGEIKK